MTACPQCSFDPLAPVLASWTFMLPQCMPSMNERISNGRFGHKYRDQRNDWIHLFKTYRMLKAITHPTGKRRVTLVRVFSGRQQLMDKANVDTKACVDAMVRAGLLTDDDAAGLELHVRQERGAERGTRVVVEEVGQ